MICDNCFANIVASSEDIPTDNETYIVEQLLSMRNINVDWKHMKLFIFHRKNLEYIIKVKAPIFYMNR